VGRKLLAAGFVALVLALAVYIGASVLVYEELTAVPGGCPESVRDNTPASFRMGDVDLDATPWLMP
jgi:hypothetical protein